MFYYSPYVTSGNSANWWPLWPSNIQRTHTSWWQSLQKYSIGFSWCLWQKILELSVITEYIDLVSLPSNERADTISSGCASSFWTKLTIWLTGYHTPHNSQYLVLSDKLLGSCWTHSWQNLCLQASSIGILWS